MEKFVANINVTAKNYSHIIPAGTAFEKTELVESTFDSLVRAGNIEPVIAGIVNTPAISPRKDKKAITQGLEQETPDASLNPPKVSEAQKLANAEASKKANAEAAAAQKIEDAKAKDAGAVTEADEKKLRSKITELTGKIPAANCSIATLVKKLNKANQAVANRTKGATDPIWIANPEAIKDLPTERLIDLYKQTCEQYGFDVKTFEKDDDIRAQLSADYIKPE
jgi:hypothetical protein